MTPTPRPEPPAPRRTGAGGVHWTVRDDKPTFWDRFDAGTWEPGTVAAVAGHTGPGRVMLDIGAWVGPLTLLAAARGARVVAVEADPRALELLRGNIAANPGLADRVSVCPRAASPDGLPVRLASPRKPGDSMTSVLRGDDPRAWTVPAVTPAELVRMAACGDAPLLVKVDIEGGEYALLPALAAALPAATAAVLAAFHPRELAGAGRSAAEVEAATRRCRAAFPGWRARLLDHPDGGGDPFAVAAREDATLLLEPGRPGSPMRAAQN